MAAHSVSGRRDSVLVIEPGAGRPDLRAGSRRPAGLVGDGGVWEPAARLVCEWLVG